MSENKHIGDNLIKGLQDLASELEHMQVQANLGKKEITEKYEEIKGNVNRNISQAKKQYESGTGTIGEIRNKLERLEVQLSLGKAEAKDWLKDQQENLEEGMRDLKNLFSKI
ncbi:MAG: hypothetical protein AB7O73_11470 [Bacteroidia bacterium]